MNIQNLLQLFTVSAIFKIKYCQNDAEQFTIELLFHQKIIIGNFFIGFIILKYLIKMFLLNLIIIDHLI